MQELLILHTKSLLKQIKHFNASTLVVAIAKPFFHIKFIVAIDFGQSPHSIFCIPVFSTFPPIFSLSPAFFLFPQFVPSLCNYFAFPIQLLRKLRVKYSSTKQSFRLNQSLFFTIRSIQISILVLAIKSSSLFFRFTKVELFHPDLL